MGWIDKFLPSAAGLASSAADFGFQALANSVLPMSKAQRQQNEWSSAESAKARDFSAQQAELERDWQEEMNMRYNSLQGKVAQAKAAGVNPLFAVTGSSTSPASLTGTGPSAPAAQGSMASPVGRITDMTQAALGFSKLKAEVDNLNARTRRENGEAFLLEIRGKYADSMEQAKLSEIVATASRMEADEKYILAATEQVFANIGKIYAETAESAERTKLVSEQINKTIAEILNLDADSSLKYAMFQQVGAQIRNLDADTQYKGYLAGLALEQQLTEVSKRQDIDAHIGWLAEDARRLKQATTNAEAEEVLLKLEKDIKEWQKKQAKRNYKWSAAEKTIGMFTDVVNSAASLVGAVKGMPFAPFTTSSNSSSTNTYIDGNPQFSRNPIGFNR